MNFKRSRSGAITSIIYNVVSVPFWGYFAFIMMLFLDLGVSNNTGFSSIASLLFIVLCLVASSLIAVVNFIMAIISFSYVGKKSTKYDKGKKFIITYIVLLFVQALLNTILGILMITSAILAIVTFIIALLSIICALLYLVDYIKTKKSKENLENQIMEQV